MQGILHIVIHTVPHMVIKTQPISMVNHFFNMNILESCNSENDIILHKNSNADSALHLQVSRNNRTEKPTGNSPNQGYYDVKQVLKIFICIKF